MREIASKVRETLALILAKTVPRRDVYYTYAWENCQKYDTEVGDSQPAVPAGPGMGVAADEAALAGHVQLGARKPGKKARAGDGCAEKLALDNAPADCYVQILN